MKCVVVKVEQLYALFFNGMAAEEFGICIFFTLPFLLGRSFREEKKKLALDKLPTDGRAILYSV